MKILITGSAGFVGHHTAQRFLDEGHSVVGIDSLNDYYDPALKEKRNSFLHKSPSYTFYKVDIAEYEALFQVIEKEKPEVIVHLAAQAGVRYSLVNPWAYQRSNVLGTINIFEIARKLKIKRVVMASSSSVYGANTKIPFHEDDPINHQVSLYAATKKSGEALAKTYNHLYGTEVACLRFFTVYGTWYRPDMALFSFAKNILRNKPIKLFNHGNMKRDYTFISDIVDGISAIVFKENLGYEIYNLGGDNPVPLEKLVDLLEKNLGVKVVREYLPMQPGDVESTYADISKARRDLNFQPKVHIEEGMALFAEWFLEHKDWIMSLEDAK